MEQKEGMIYTHKFSDAGLGRAPFKFLGIRENLFKMGDGSVKPGGCCDYCFNGIRWEYLILSEDGRRSKVGSDCIEKLNDHKLMTEAEKAKRDLLKARRQEQRQAKWQAEQQAQRERNGGKTDAELREEAYQSQLERDRQERQKAGLKYKEYAERLRDGKGGFRDEIAGSLSEGRLPVGRGLRIMLDILAKQAGRSGSKKYYEEMEALEKVFEPEEEDN